MRRTHFERHGIALVLPGRMARLDAELRMEDLILKGLFVRFISHELR